MSLLFSATLLVGALLCALVYVVMSLLSPVLIGQAVDGIIVPDNVDFAQIGRVALALAVVLLAGGFSPSHFVPPVTGGGKICVRGAPPGGEKTIGKKTTRGGVSARRPGGELGEGLWVGSLYRDRGGARLG